MGVLDEAIRQHLELKRRRGADAGEIKREEDEALGEVRVSRGPGSDAEPAAPAAAEVVPQADAESSAGEHAEQDRDSIAHQPTEAFDSAELAEALGQSPDAAADVPQIAESELAEPETEHAEPAAEDEVAEEQQPEDEDDVDELEETPEFLEDAPEHDKLWFEQKPPKDFDF